MGEGTDITDADERAEETGTDGSSDEAVPKETGAERPVAAPRGRVTSGSSRELGHAPSYNFAGLLRSHLDPVERTLALELDRLARERDLGCERRFQQDLGAARASLEAALRENAELTLQLTELQCNKAHDVAAVRSRSPSKGSVAAQHMISKSSATDSDREEALDGIASLRSQRPARMSRNEESIMTLQHTGSFVMELGNPMERLKTQVDVDLESDAMDREEPSLPLENYEDPSQRIKATTRMPVWDQFFTWAEAAAGAVASAAGAVSSAAAPALRQSRSTLSKAVGATSEPGEPISPTLEVMGMPRFLDRGPGAPSPGDPSGTLGGLSRSGGRPRSGATSTALGGKSVCLGGTKEKSVVLEGPSHLKCSCGVHNPTGAAYCGACGKAMAQGRKCVQCGHVLADKALFCVKCGMRSHTRIFMADTAFAVLPAWREGLDPSQNESGTCVTRVNRASKFRNTLSMRRYDSEKERRRGSFDTKGNVMHPTCKRRMMWDLITCTLLTYEALYLPLTFLELEQPPAVIFMTWVTRLFWTVDIVLSFFTGYDRPDGEVELWWVKVAARYVRSPDGLFLDAVMVSCDWILFFLSGSSFVGAARSIKLLKALRFVRMFKMVRLVRFSQLMNKYMPQISYLSRSVVATVVVGLVRIMVLLLIANHFLACCWCWIGEESRLAGGDTWLTSYDFLLGSGIGEQYAVAFHWSLTQFVGSTDVNPRNMYERVYTISVLLIGFLVMSTVPPAITTLMTTFQAAATENNAEMRQLTHYLQDNRISQELAVRVQRAALSALRVERQATPENKVTVLAKVSGSLQTEVKYEIFSPGLLEHPFFKRLNEFYPEIFLSVCHRAVSRFTVPAQENVFEENDVPENPGMLFVLSGRLTYKSESQPAPTRVYSGSWLCEACLWTDWFYRGDCTAVVDSVVVVVDAKGFQEALLTGGLKRREAQRYAERFVLMLNEAGFDDVYDVLNMEYDAQVRQMALEVFPKIIRNGKLPSRLPSSINMS